MGESNVQHDQGKGYQQQPITFRRVSQSGQVEIKIEYLYTIPNTYNLVLNGAWHCSTVGLVEIIGHWIMSILTTFDGLFDLVFI